jgi:hypothetical protein
LIDEIWTLSKKGQRLNLTTQISTKIGTGIIACIRLSKMERRLPIECKSIMLLQQLWNISITSGY